MKKLALLAAATTLATATAKAADTNWNGGEADWDSANWSGGTMPTDSQTVNFNAGGTINFGSTARTTKNPDWINNGDTPLVFKGTGDGGLTIDVDYDFDIGRSGSGSLTLLGGTYCFKDLRLGWDTNNKGYLTVGEGAVCRLQNWTSLGIGGNTAAHGEIVVDGGTLVTGNDNTAGTISVGNEAGTTGTLEVKSGTLTGGGTGDFIVGNASGAKAVYKQSGGAVTIPNNILAAINGSTAEMTLSGGEMSVAAFYIGDNGGKGTLNLDGGVLSTKGIYLRTAGDGVTATLNANGGTLAPLNNELSIGDTVTVNVKAGGLVVSNDTDFTINADLIADESLGGIVKQGEGQLNIPGARFTKGVGFIKVEKGTLRIYDSQLPSADKVVIASGAKLDLGYNTELVVRSLVNNGEITSPKGTGITQMENPPALTKAVWLNTLGDGDAKNPVNWAVYYNDGEKDVRVSADELPTSDTEIVVEGAIDAELPDLTGVTVKSAVLKLNADVEVTVSDEGTVTHYALASGWSLDASGATLTVKNAAKLAAGTTATVVTSAGVVDGGQFSSVSAGSGETDVVRAAYGNDGTVTVSRAGGMVLIVR